MSRVRGSIPAPRARKNTGTPNTGAPNIGAPNTGAPSIGTPYTLYKRKKCQKIKKSKKIF